MRSCFYCTPELVDGEAGDEDDGGPAYVEFVSGKVGKDSATDTGKARSGSKEGFILESKPVNGDDGNQLEEVKVATETVRSGRSSIKKETEEIGKAGRTGSGR